jgi:hypothetical protein
VENRRSTNLGGLIGSLLELHFWPPQHGRIQGYSLVFPGIPNNFDAHLCIFMYILICIMYIGVNFLFFEQKLSSQLLFTASFPFQLSRPAHEGQGRKAQWLTKPHDHTRAPLFRTLALAVRQNPQSGTSHLLCFPDSSLDEWRRCSTSSKQW